MSRHLFGVRCDHDRLEQRVAALLARDAELAAPVLHPPDLPTRRRLQIEQCLARTGSIARTMAECETDYATVRALLEWMAA